MTEVFTRLFFESTENVQIFSIWREKQKDQMGRVRTQWKSGKAFPKPYLHFCPKEEDAQSSILSQRHSIPHEDHSNSLLCEP